MLKTTCNHCKTSLNFEERKVGQVVKCPKCGKPTKLGLPDEPDTWNGIIRDEPVKPSATDKQVQRLKKSVRNRTVTMIVMFVVFVAAGAVMASRMGGKPEPISNDGKSDRIAKLEAEKAEWLATKKDVLEKLIALKNGNEKMLETKIGQQKRIKKISAGIKKLYDRNAELEKKAAAWDALVAAEARQDAVRKSVLEESWLLLSQSEKDRVERIRESMKKGEIPDSKERIGYSNSDSEFTITSGWIFLKEPFAKLMEKEWKCKSVLDFLNLKGEQRQEFFRRFGRRPGLGLVQDINMAVELMENQKAFFANSIYMRKARNSPFFRAKLIELQKKK